MAYDEDVPVFDSAPAAARRITRNGKRFYFWRQEPFWSVTTILDALGKHQSLVYWSANGVARWTVDHFDQLTLMMQSEDPEIVYERLKKIPWEKRDRAGNIGTSVHAAIEAYALDKPMPPWPPVIKPRMDAFVQFLADFDPTFEATEVNVYNRTEHYAGTLDALISLPASTTSLVWPNSRPDRPLRVLLDVKTGKTIGEDIALQMAAYRHADTYLAAPDGSEHPLPVVDTCAVLHLPADGSYSLIEFRADAEVFKAFLYVREVFRWRERLSKTVIMPPMRPSFALEPDPERREQSDCRHFGVSGDLTLDDLLTCACTRCLRELNGGDPTLVKIGSETPEHDAGSPPASAQSTTDLTTTSSTPQTSAPTPEASAEPMSLLDS